MSVQLRRVRGLSTAHCVGVITLRIERFVRRAGAARCSGTNFAGWLMANKRTGRMPPDSVEKVHERSRGICERCLTRPAVDIHHRRFLSRGGGHNLANMLHLCGTGNMYGCHGEAHKGSTATNYGLSISRFNKLQESEIEFVDNRGRAWLLGDDGSKREVKHADVQ